MSKYVRISQKGLHITSYKQYRESTGSHSIAGVSTWMGDRLRISRVVDFVKGTKRRRILFFFFFLQKVLEIALNDLTRL